MRADSYYPGPIALAIGRARQRFIDRVQAYLDGLWREPAPEPKPKRRATAKPRQKVRTPLMLPAPTHPESRTIH